MLLEKYNITPETLGVLNFINLNTQGDPYVESIIKLYLYDESFETGPKFLEMLIQEELVEYTKQKTKSTPWKSLRLSSKGKDILKSLSQKPNHPLADECYTILEEAYKTMVEDKSKIVNKTKTTYYISEFLYHKEEQGKQYTVKMFKAVIYAYIGSFSHERMKYIPKTLNLLFKPLNVYSTKWKPEESPLEEWVNSNTELIKTAYKKLT